MLINYFPELITKIVGYFKDKVISLFNTNTSTQTVYGRQKRLRKPKTQKQSEESINNSIWKKKKEIKDRIIKYRLIRDIRTFFEEEEKDYYKPKTVSNFWNNNYIE